MATEIRKVDYLLYEPEEETGILWIRMNRPERLNALMPDTEELICEYMEAGDNDPRIRVIVLTGNGRAFCAGADMRGAGQNSDPEREQHSPGPDASRARFVHESYTKYTRITEIRKPTIAMLNGAAVGRGMDLALRCDIRMGCENTRFFTYQNLGQIIENGGMYYLPKLMGLGRSLEFLFTGGFLTADDAYRTGVINHLVPSEELEKETRAICQKIVDSPPMVQWVGKRIMRRALDTDIHTVQDLCANASGIFGGSFDAAEGRAAFLEKRRPVYQGR